MQFTWKHDFMLIIFAWIDHFLYPLNLSTALLLVWCWFNIACVCFKVQSIPGKFTAMPEKL